MEAPRSKSPFTRDVTTRIRAALVLLITVSVLAVNTDTSAGARESHAIYGILSVRGAVMVNDRAASDGQTLLEAAKISTAANSDSTIVLENRSQLHLSALSELTIDSSQKHLFGSLPTGRVLVNVPAGVSVNFHTTDLSIKKTAVDEVVLIAVRATECEGTNLEVIAGRVEAHINGRSRVIEAGNAFSTTTASAIPQSSQNSFSKKKLGIVFGIGGAIAIVLAVALGHHSENQQNPVSGGCVIVPSPGSPSGC